MTTAAIAIRLLQAVSCILEARRLRMHHTSWRRTCRRRPGLVLRCSALYMLRMCDRSVSDMDSAIPSKSIIITRYRDGNLKRKAEISPPHGRARRKQGIQAMSSDHLDLDLKQQTHLYVYTLCPSRASLRQWRPRHSRRHLRRLWWGISRPRQKSQSSGRSCTRCLHLMAGCECARDYGFVDLC